MSNTFLPAVVEPFLSQIVPDQSSHVYFEVCGVHNQMHKSWLSSYNVNFQDSLREI